MNQYSATKHSRGKDRTTTVFTSGNSQAVRLPKEFRFSSKTVLIERRGDEIVLREKPSSLGHKLRELFADLPPLTPDEDAALTHMATSRKELRPLEERDFGWMDAESTTPSKTKPAKRKR